MAVEVEGPVYRERTSSEHQGEMQDNTDYLFRARCRRMSRS